MERSNTRYLLENEVGIVFAENKGRKIGVILSNIGKRRGLDVQLYLESSCSICCVSVRFHCGWMLPFIGCLPGEFYCDGAALSV
jgi:hypothetical protein